MPAGRALAAAIPDLTKLHWVQLAQCKERYLVVHVIEEATLAVALVCPEFSRDANRGLRKW